MLLLILSGHVLALRFLCEKQPKMSGFVQRRIRCYRKLINAMEAELLIFYLNFTKTVYEQLRLYYL